jgi:hypothetical protein
MVGYVKVHPGNADLQLCGDGLEVTGNAAGARRVLTRDKLLARQAADD